MAFGVFKLNINQRKILGIIFMCMNIIQILGGLFLVTLSFYMYTSVAPILYSERAEISFVFFVIGLNGVHVILVYSYGLKICWKCQNQAHKKSTRNLVFSWICVTFYILFCLFILGTMGRKVYKHIIRSMKHSLHIGMIHYLTNDMWKVTIDRIQYDLQCCGITTYKEWHKIAWLNKYHINQKAELVKQFGTPQGFWPVTPWSCCRITFPVQCLHDPLQQVHSVHLWSDQPSLIIQSINPKGCLEELKVPIYAAFVLFILTTVFIFLIQIFIFLTLRILYTSCRNAKILKEILHYNDINEVAPGWIFGRGDFGYNGGKGLVEIMGMDDQKQPSPEETKQNFQSDKKETGSKKS